MSVYSVKGKGWRYDFILNGNRYSAAGFQTKQEARQAEAKRREELTQPIEELNKMPVQMPIGMGFLELLNKRLDYVKIYNGQRHYTDHIYLAKRWVRMWKTLQCHEITTDMVQTYLIQRARQKTAHTANRELRTLRALFNFGIHPARAWIHRNPTHGIAFFPAEKHIKYVPPKEDVLRVILAADPDMQDYLWTVVMTLARVGEINRLTWQDVNLKDRFLILYTRKKRGSHLTPRKVPMPEKLHQILVRRFEKRDKHKAWVFWHRYYSVKEGRTVEGPYLDRKSVMRSLCKKADVPYFRYHALRHFGASVLDQANVPIGSIQRILGHENRTTTEIYLHSIGEAEREAMV